MPTETEKLMENVAAVHSFLEKDYSPLKEEVERLSVQITESMSGPPSGLPCSGR